MLYMERPWIRPLYEIKSHTKMIYLCKKQYWKGGIQPRKIHDRATFKTKRPALSRQKKNKRGTRRGFEVADVQKFNAAQGNYKYQHW